MDVWGFITKIEQDHLEEDLADLSAKERIMIYLSAKEFMLAKLQRATAAPVTIDDTEITIKIVNTSADVS